MFTTFRRHSLVVRYIIISNDDLRPWHSHCWAERVVNHIEDYGHADIINAHLRLIAPPAGLCEWPQPPGFLNLSGLHYSGGLTWTSTCWFPICTAPRGDPCCYCCRCHHKYSSIIWELKWSFVWLTLKCPLYTRGKFYQESTAEFWDICFISHSFAQALQPFFVFKNHSFHLHTTQDRQNRYNYSNVNADLKL